MYIKEIIYTCITKLIRIAWCKLPAKLIACMDQEVEEV